MYLFILWANRHSLNPSVDNNSKSMEENLGTQRVGRVEIKPSDRSPTKSGSIRIGGGGGIKVMTLEEAQDLEKRVHDRKTNLELVPSMFLWKDYGETFRAGCIVCKLEVARVGQLWSALAELSSE